MNKRTIEGVHLLSEDCAHRLFEGLAAFLKPLEELSSTRIELQQQRTALRYKRQQVSDCDRQFMDALRSSWTQFPELRNSSLNELFERCDEARNVYGPAEYEFEKLDLQMGAKDYKFDIEGQKFYSQCKLHNISANGEAESKGQPLTQSALSLLNSQQFKHSLSHQGPLLYHEEIAPVNEEKKSLQADYSPASDFPKSSAASPNLALSSKALKAPVGPPEPLLSHIYLSDGDYGQRQLYSPLSSSINGDIETESQISASESGRPLFLDSDLDNQSILSDYLVKFTGTHNRINQWLLHKLRQSEWEIFRLKQEANYISPNLSFPWAHLSLEMWGQDDAALEELKSPTVLSYLTDLLRSEESSDFFAHELPSYPPPPNYVPSSPRSTGMLSMRRFNILNHLFAGDMKAYLRTVPYSV